MSVLHLTSAFTLSMKIQTYYYNLNNIWYYEVGDNNDKYRANGLGRS